MPEAGGAGRILLFGLGPDRFALPAGCVREVLRPPVLTRLPGAPPALAGLANLRGEPLPVLDLRHLLRPDHGSVPARGRVIVVEAGDPVGFAVDRVLGLADAAGLDPAGEEDGPAAAGRLPGSGTPLLDPGRVVAAAVRRTRPSRTPVAAPAGPGLPRPPAEEAPALVTVRAAGRLCALPLADVAAILARPGSLPLPAGGAALGATEWRGRVLPLLSLSALLGFGAGAPDPAARVVVTAGGGAGLVVDGLGPVLRPEPAAIDPVPRNLGPGAAAFAAILRRPGGEPLVPVLSLERLLGPGFGEARAETAAPARPVAGEPVLAVDLAGTAYGLPVAAIREVLRVPEAVTRLPRTPDGVAGLIDHGGGTLPLIDQRRRLGHPASRPGPRRRLVVLDRGGSRAGLIVDGVAGLRVLDPARIRPAPDPGGTPAAAVDRVGGLDDGRLLLLVDLAALLDGIGRDLLAGPAGAAAAGCAAA
ncbi:MAG: chemotaxis protein CheW [Methylobacterium frigidaeris]